jgi:pyruvate,water dikinase
MRWMRPGLARAAPAARRLDKTDVASLARAGARRARSSTPRRCRPRWSSSCAKPGARCRRRSAPTSAWRCAAATAEDLPTASFAGQHDTYLNVQGEEMLIDAVKRCQASLFTDRAISYRTDQGFDHFKVSLSVAVMQMVRSDLASSGVMFTIDTESGHPDFVFITGAWGLGENVVQGAVDPDEFYVHKPTYPGPPRVLRARWATSRSAWSMRPAARASRWSTAPRPRPTASASA